MPGLARRWCKRWFILLLLRCRQFRLASHSITIPIVPIATTFWYFNSCTHSLSLTSDYPVMAVDTPTSEKLDQAASVFDKDPTTAERLYKEILQDDSQRGFPLHFDALLPPRVLIEVSFISCKRRPFERQRSRPRQVGHSLQRFKVFIYPYNGS